jgi:multisubunit Na+/H+ antiporter MnhB subunit
MNWTLVLIGFSLAVLMGAGLVALLAAVRPEWTPRKRELIAASALPAITAVATALVLVLILAGNYDATGQMRDLATAALLTIGGGFTVLAFLGGLIGALLAGRRYR